MNVGTRRRHNLKRGFLLTENFLIEMRKAFQPLCRPVFSSSNRFIHRFSLQQLSLFNHAEHFSVAPTPSTPSPSQSLCFFFFSSFLLDTLIFFLTRPFSISDFIPPSSSPSAFNPHSLFLLNVSLSTQFPQHVSLFSLTL